jgi:hypothetical protein
MKIMLAALTLTLASAVSAAPGGEDPDSFGNRVIYLGMVDTRKVSLQAKCPAPPVPPAPDDRCIELSPQPAATAFDEDNIGSIELPGGATSSLVCFSLTPIAGYTFRNLTAVAQPVAHLRVALQITIESSVLQDPTLIHPTTGLPLNGRLEHGMSVLQEGRSMDVGEYALSIPSYSRGCAYGFIHRASLIDSYGLTPAQADSFFAGPITLTFGAAGSAKVIESAQYRFVVRLYGDRK